MDQDAPVTFTRADVVRAEEQALEALRELAGREEEEEEKEKEEGQRADAKLPRTKRQLLRFLAPYCTVRTGMEEEDVRSLLGEMQAVDEAGLVTPKLGELRGALEEQMERGGGADHALQIVHAVLKLAKAGKELNVAPEALVVESQVPVMEVLEELELNEYITVSEDDEVQLHFGVITGKTQSSSSYWKSLIPLVILFMMFPTLTSSLRGIMSFFWSN